MSKTTIKDIAEHLELSTSTVSRALNGHSNIGEKTRQRVSQAAVELGYSRPSKNKIIGLIIPEVVRFFVPDMINEIENVAKKVGYTIITLQSDESLNKEIDCTTLCQSFNVDGLLVSLSKETKNSLKHFDYFFKKNIPIVFLDKIPEKIDLAKVGINDFKAAYTAIRFLIGKGYKKIAGIFASEDLFITRQRKEGFIRAIEIGDIIKGKKTKIKFYKEFCKHIDKGKEKEAKDKFAAILRLEEKPDAVFAMTDEILVGVIQAIEEQGLKIPENIAVISVSNGHLPNYIFPNITHIKHSGAEIGKEAANYLYHLIEHPDWTKIEFIEKDTVLVIKESC